MSSFDPIDSWFEKGFRIRQQKAAKTASLGRRDRIRSSGGGSPSRRGSVSFSSSAKAKNIKSVIRKAPEVMVKITGSSAGLKSVKHHLEYISRNGQVELTSEAGESIKGLAELKGFREQLKASQIPEVSPKREFIHVLFSMPPGTDEKSVREAVAQFCQEEFSNRQYVMAQHDDTDHSHVHVCVSTRDMDRADEARLSPRKNDLFRWRQGFADKLRELGVDAAASERRHRFNYRKSENSVVRQIRADNPKSSAFNAKRFYEKQDDRAFKAATNPSKAFTGPIREPRTPRVYEALKTELSAAIKAGERPLNPAIEKIENTRAKTLSGWEAVANNLDRAGDAELAVLVREILKDGAKTPVSRNQELFDSAINRSMDIDKDLDTEIER